LESGLRAAIEGTVDRRPRELVILALLSAVLFVIALMYERPLAAVVFAALTFAIGVIALLLRRSPDELER
jgi:uncharacterized membrane protein